MLVFRRLSRWCMQHSDGNDMSVCGRHVVQKCCVGCIPCTVVCCAVCEKREGGGEGGEARGPLKVFLKYACSRYAY